MKSSNVIKAPPENVVLEAVEACVDGISALDLLNLCKAAGYGEYESQRVFQKLMNSGDITIGKALKLYRKKVTQ